MVSVSSTRVSTHVQGQERRRQLDSSPSTRSFVFESIVALYSLQGFLSWCSKMLLVFWSWIAELEIHFHV